MDHVIQLAQLRTPQTAVFIRRWTMSTGKEQKKEAKIWTKTESGVKTIRVTFHLIEMLKLNLHKFWF